MFAKLLLKVTNIIKREKIKPTQAKADGVEQAFKIQPSLIIAPAIIAPAIIAPAIIAPAIIAPAIIAPAIIAPAIIAPAIIAPAIIAPTMETISDEPNQSTNSIKSQCKTCAGCGFVKTVTIICDTCKGIKCMACNSLGLSRLPWSECHICYGSGEIIHS